MGIPTLDRAFQVIAFLVVTLAASAGGAGTKEKEEARDHASRATAAYNLGQYAEAAPEFEAAYKLVQDPAFLFNIGQTYRLLGEREKAVIAYRSYLRTAPPEAADREQAERWRARLEASRAGPSPAPAAISTAAVAPATASPPAPSPQLAPKVVSSTAPLASPATSSWNQETPDVSDRPPVYKRWWFWTIVGVAAAGVTTAVLLSRDRTNPDCLGTTPCGSIP